MLIRANSFWMPLADESVHCVVTSPPYWGLRDYHLRPLVWPANGNRRESVGRCEHVWGNLVVQGKRGQAGNESTLRGEQSGGRIQKIQCGCFCEICGAWRGALGLEPTPELYVEHIVQIFREVRRVLRSDGTLWLKMGDCYATGAGAAGECPGGGERGANWAGQSAGRSHSYGPMTQPNRMPIAGLKPKDLVGMPWRVAFALQADGWWLRRDIVWSKPNPMPESAPDRPTTAHEYVFLLAKSGGSQYWTHVRGTYPGRREQPEPDYIWIERTPAEQKAAEAEAEEIGELADDWQLSCSGDGEGFEESEGPAGVRAELATVPFGWTAEKSNPVNRQWRRVNLWRSHDYFYDAAAIAEPQSENERRGRLREQKEGLESVYQLARDGKTGIHDQSESGICRSARGRQEAALRGTRERRSVWEIPTQAFRGAHFATFPERLGQICIAAGTSEHGCCATCGAPWERIASARARYDGTVRKHIAGEDKTIGHGWKDSPRATVSQKTIGWQPTCSCSPFDQAQRLAPAIVLDPFGGSGTVGEVAFKMGRRFVCVELKEEYLALTKERIPPMAFQL